MSDLGDEQAPSNSLWQRDISTTSNEAASGRNLLVGIQQPQNISYHAAKVLKRMERPIVDGVDCIVEVWMLAGIWEVVSYIAP